MTSRVQRAPVGQTELKGEADPTPEGQSLPRQALQGMQIRPSGGWKGTCPKGTDHMGRVVCSVVGRVPPPPFWSFWSNSACTDPWADFFFALDLVLPVLNVLTKC